MVEMNNFSSPELVTAVSLWTGWGHCMMPNRSEKRLADHFGAEAATQMLNVIKRLESDSYSSDARLAAKNLEEMDRLASDEFRRKYPTVAEDIVKAFAWCYTFDFR